MSYIRNRLIACTFLASFAVLGGSSGLAHATGPAPCTVPSLSPAPAIGLGDRVDRLEDLRQIEELRARYSYALDQTVADPRKVDLLLDLFVDDICIDYGPFGRYRGKRAIKDYYTITNPTVSAWSFHYALHPLLTVNSYQATGIWRVMAHGVFKSDYSQVITVYGTYNDAYVKTPSGWKFRTILLAFDTPPTGP